MMLLFISIFSIGFVEKKGNTDRQNEVFHFEIFLFVHLASY